MEGLTRLVAESMARHGLDVPLDHRRLQWSRWFRCEPNFNLLLAPSKPGLFALGEELIAPNEIPVADGKRMLAVFQISEAEDLGLALSRLFAPHSPLKHRIANGRVFLRYSVIEDAAQRHTAHSALQHWLTSSAEIVSAVSSEFGLQATAPSPQAQEGRKAQEIQAPAPFPAGF